MKQLVTLFILWLLITQSVSAQHYSCVSPEYKTYFTNAKGYLKGMRIDSVKVIGANTVYYPFHTARISSLAYNEYADTMGGSWMGKEIVQAADTSVTYIANLWGDTITIKNEAQSGESWLWYGNPDSLHFVATIISHDTQRINGNYDSVKTIRLTMMNGLVEQVDDSLHHLDLILSKHNGFLQAIDFYLFPYRLPGDSVSDRRIDVYLDEMNMGFGNEVSAQGVLFSRVNYVAPEATKIEDYEVGDVFLRIIKTGFLSEYPRTEQRDSVMLRNDINGIVYTILRHYATTKIAPGGAGLETITGTETVSLPVPYMLLADTTKMPEEWYSGGFSYFFENDTSFCYRSNRHAGYNHFILRDGYYSNFEITRSGWNGKDGLGSLSSGYTRIPTQEQYSEYLKGARKGTFFCGSDNTELSIGSTPKSELACRIFPNPANDLIRVAINGSVAFRVELMDIAGRSLSAVQQSAGSEAIVDVSGVFSGMYLLNITTKTGRSVRKIVVQR